MTSCQTFKYVNYIIDNDTSSSSSSSATLLATVISFLTSPSFHDSINTILPSSLPTSSPLLNWLSTPSSTPPCANFPSPPLSPLSFPIFFPDPKPKLNFHQTLFFPPCIFLLLVSPFRPPPLPHPHARVLHLPVLPRLPRFRAPLPPGFHGHYNTFSPNSNLSLLDWLAFTKEGPAWKKVVFRVLGSAEKEEE
ncbi:hypothetical protein JHK82_033555 [Glycine max]|nr:hypothetical protein JHK85_034273 [Glycine max]KAG4985951.1 hypothetical protein JHK86_033642 [Glycine max]KAG5119135.1 hypothetical protein JHK82_033555 [Glycine max]KAG5140123.1 hypothetical protein JHK84_033891 [Glycine max]